MSCQDLIAAGVGHVSPKSTTLSVFIVYFFLLNYLINVKQRWTAPKSPSAEV